MDANLQDLSVISENLNSVDEEIRRVAVISLMGFPFDQVKGMLFSAMGDSSWRVRKEAVEAVSTAPFSDSLIEDLVGLLRSHDNAGLRNSSVEVLTRLGTRALEGLSRHLQDADQDVRKFIVDILGDIGATDTVPLLIEAIDDPDQNVCAAAIENLGKIGDATAISHLLQCLSRPDVMLKFTALEALVKIGKPLPIHQLLPLAREKFLKKALFDCFGMVGDAEAVPFLLEGLQESRSIREAAAVALVKIRSVLSHDMARDQIDVKLALLKGAPAVSALIESLPSDDQVVKESLVTILGVIGDERAAAPLLKLACDGRLARHCIRAFTAMGEAGGSFLMDSFPSADEKERRFIAYACGELALQNCTELLWQGMRDPHSELRAVCVKAAGKTGQGMLVDRVAALLDDESAEVREASMQALSLLAHTARTTVVQLAQTLELSASPEKRTNAAVLFAVLGDMEKLSILVKDENMAVREAAVLALAKDASKEGLGHLVMALVDEAADVRIAAARALGERGGEEVLDPLLLALNDDDPWVTCEALKSLGKLGSERAIKAVADMVESSDPPVTIAALESLAALSGVRSSCHIAKALDHGDEEVVKAAVELLAQMGDEWVDEHKEKLLRHPHWDVRRSFARTLAMLRGKAALPELRESLKLEVDGLVKRQLAELVERLQ